MPKRIGYLYESLTSWSNLYLAYKKACKHKKSKSETTEWMYNCEEYLFELQAELRALGRGFPNPHNRDAEWQIGICHPNNCHPMYHPQPYKYFVIREPKERIISVAAFRDRVVHHALVNIIEPYFEATFIKDSYATRKDKGLHLAVQAAQAYACRYKWYLKLDIQKFFASVNHDVLLSLIKRKIKDPAVMSLCRIILSNQTVSMGMEENKGLPVGNLTSQFFANIYLNQLDHFVKQTLSYQAYVRYMDDFILFSNDPIDLKEALKKIEQFVQLQLQLRIKPKSVQINRVTHGIPYLGYRIFPKLLRIRRENLKRCLNGIEKTEQAYIKGKISAEVLYQSTRSRMGFIGFAHSTLLLQSIWGRNQQAGLTV